MALVTCKVSAKYLHLAKELLVRRIVFKVNAVREHKLLMFHCGSIRRVLSVVLHEELRHTLPEALHTIVIPAAV